MVVARNTELYAPFEQSLLIEDPGVQSSEEGSDLHSPTFEVPVPQDSTSSISALISFRHSFGFHSSIIVHYHLGHPQSNVELAASLVPPHFDARYHTQNLNVQIPGPHLLETLQAPGTIPYHLIPPQSHIDFDLRHHSVFDSGVERPHLQPSALSPSEEYSFNLPQTSYSEQQLRVSYEPPSVSSRSPFAMASDESSEQHPRTSPSASGNASGSNAASGSTRPPRREASTQVIACRQWYAN